MNNPDRISFNSIKLRPCWFVNAEVRNLVFNDVEWQNLEIDTDRSGLDREFDKLIEEEVQRPKESLIKACNQLADNAEANRRFEEATNFRYMAMQTKRFDYWLHGWFYTLNWLYWLSSGYGERRIRAAVNLILVLVLFGVLYATPLSRFDYGEKSSEKSADAVEQQIFCCAGSGERFREMNLGEGFVHSLSVAAFQRPEPKSADTTTKLFIFLESIFAPLQAALLALSIRRKFMR